jgi:uncharacterized OB-fold protein
MPLYEYKDQLLNIIEQDSEYFGYFEAAKEHKLVVKKCLDCGLLRGDPGASCPWCSSMQSEWHEVSGKGTIYSYQIIPHAILPGFRDWTPYAAVLVELDEQSGEPTENDGLRITTNLLTENMEPENEENVAIGKRVNVVFMDMEDGLTLPQFALSDEEPAGEVWRYPAT